MSRIVDDEPPIKSHVANRAFRDNYDRIFGEPAVDVPSDALCEQIEKACDALDADAIECRLTSYANLIVPAYAGVIKCCTCDEPACASWPCKELRELRIAHAVITRLIEDEARIVETLKDLLDEIESDCEILCK